MKVVYEDGEIERLEEAQKKLQEMHPNRFNMFDENDPDRIYSLSFKVTNHAIAEYIIPALLHNKLEDFELGIEVTSINFGDLSNKDEVRKKLHKMIDEILN